MNQTQQISHALYSRMSIVVVWCVRTVQTFAGSLYMFYYSFHIHIYVRENENFNYGCDVIVNR
jgi:hypothetical protein